MTNARIGEGFKSAAHPWLVVGLQRPGPTMAPRWAAVTNSTPRAWHQGGAPVRMVEHGKR
jgi:hypothetical protein